MVALDAVMLQPTTLDWLAGGKMVRYRLVTHHDTIVYWDPQTKEIRHALFGSALLNIALQRLGDQAVLLISVSQGTSNHGMAGFAKDLMVDAGGQPVIGGIVVESLTEDVVGLRIGTHYLSADTDGLIRNDRAHCREWERYRLVREDMLDGIAIASRFSWVSHSDRRLLTLPGETGTKLSSMQEFQFGGVRVPIQCSTQSIFFEYAASNFQPLPTAMHVVGAQGQLRSFSRYMPLVYFFVYGHESFYQSLQVTLSSLERYGRYDGMIAIACDLDAGQVLKYVPKSFHDRCIVTEASKERGYFNRYSLDEEVHARYQPIVCSGVDVVFDCDVTDLLIDILRQDKVCLATEDIIELVEKSPRFWPEYTEREFPLQGIALGNAGMIGFPNLHRVQRLFDLYKSVAGRQTSQQLKGHTAQAILSYVLNKTESGDYSVMSRYGRISRTSANVPVSERSGFVHFHRDSGLADAASNLSAMELYLNRLSTSMHGEGIRTAAAPGIPERESRPDGTVVRNVIDGQSIGFLIINPHDEIMRYHNAGTFYEAEELELIKRHCTGEGVFVDIGANVGNHSVYASCFLRCRRIVPFEPNQAAIAIMRENLQLNRCDNVDTRFLGIALAGKKGRLKQVTPDANNLGHTLYFEDGVGDILAIDGDALIGDEPIEFIKIDVEGMEIEILLGLERTIKRWQPTIFVEVWDDRSAAFKDWCERASYQLVESFCRYEAIQNYLIKPIP